MQAKAVRPKRWGSATAANHFAEIEQAAFSPSIVVPGVGFSPDKMLQARDFTTGNFIVIGSKRGVPSVELFEQHLNFRLKHIGSPWRFGFVDQKPQSRGNESYFTSVPPNTPTESYATIAFLPKTARTVDVLLLDGLVMEATEAAGELCMGGGLTKRLAGKLNVKPQKKQPYFEVLLKIRIVAGDPRNLEVMAWRRSNLI